MNFKTDQIDKAELTLLYNIADIILDDNIKTRKAEKSVNKLYGKINSLKYIKTRISRKLKSMDQGNEK